MQQLHAHDSRSLQQACDTARPGDVILVQGGRYDRVSKLSRKTGTRDRPITFRAADQAWISGGKQPDPHLGGGNPAHDAPNKPGVDDFALLFIDKCAHITIEGLKVRDCWPSILSVKDSSHLIVRDCDWRHATYAIFAKGEQTSHLLIERNRWQQDDSADHLLWTEHDWARAHGNEGSDGLLRYFNGGFLSAKAIRGNVVVRQNQIMDAYNGIRLKSGDTPPPPGEMAEINADVHIFDNDFVRIRDNPIEPEVSAYNWHVRHNRLVDCHSWFSFDGLSGGFWYFYGNTGTFTSRQGQQGMPSHTMGRVLKLSYEMRPRGAASEYVAIHPWFVFNNSWHLRCPLIGGANPTIPPAGEGPDFTAFLDFFNNAFQWCDQERQGAWLCESVEMVRYFDFARSQQVKFDYSISNRASYFTDMRPHGNEANGIGIATPVFVPPADGIFSFRLPAGSQAQGSGVKRNMAQAGGAPSAAATLQADGSLNRGALQDYGLIEVPALEAQADRLLQQI